MWSTVQNSATEKAALFSLLDEYFGQQERTPSSTTTTSTTSSSHAPTSLSSPPRLPGRSLPPPTTRPTTATSTLPTPNSSTSSFSSSAPSTSFRTTLADQALQQPALSSAALRQAGLSPKAANLAAQFGAQHHTVLAPHVANAAQKGWNAQHGHGAAPGATAAMASPPPKMPPARGPKPPSGLNTTSAKSFGKAMTSLKAPMPKHDPSKAAYTEALATHAPIKVNNNVPTPPYRVTQAALAPPLNSAGLGQTKALYDYEGAEQEDLAVKEGEVVTVVEDVSDEWCKCEAGDGRKGIVPRAYLEAL